MRETYEYVGFFFYVLRDARGVVDNMEALPDQHQAAYKDKHRRAALEQFKDEGNA